MNKIIIALLTVFAVVLSACAPYNPQGGDQKFCTEDAKVCSDGSAVGRDPNNNCEFMPCPEDKVYVERDPEQCKLIKFMCVQGKQPFFDDKGCGCEPIPTTGGDGKLQAYDCTDPRPEACTKEYMPVCGQVQVQCITTPCDPIRQTFGNKCEACANPGTISYIEGACTDSEIPDTQLALFDQCEIAGGKWIESAQECEGITVDQCDDMGGRFNECASACRNTKSEACTLQCVQVCEFKDVSLPSDT